MENKESKINEYFSSVNSRQQNGLFHAKKKYLLNVPVQKFSEYTDNLVIKVRNCLWDAAIYANESVPTVDRNLANNSILSNWLNQISIKWTITELGLRSSNICV